MIKEFNNLDKILLLFVFLAGSLILFLPVQQLLFLLGVFICFIFLFFNPKIAFYVMLFFAPWTRGIPLDYYSETPFNQTDILITICFLNVLYNVVFKERFKINLKTNVDFWIVILFIIYFVSGFTSASHRGYQGFLRFGEVISVFYMTNYFLKTKVIKLSELINVVLLAGMYQAGYGMLQSITGSFGTDFQSNRGYLGLLGLGSGSVWHGRGSFNHFNILGPFLFTIFLFYLPIYHFITKNKKYGTIALIFIFFGFIMTYSRGSLMGLLLGIFFFIFKIQKDKIKFMLKAMPVGLMLYGVVHFLKNSSYAETISERNEVWALAIRILTSTPKNFFIGSGLKSYEDAVLGYLPGNTPPESALNFLAHNFILFFAVEMGVIGALTIVMFLFHNFIVAYKNIANNSRLIKALGFSICMIIIAFTVEGTFDMGFNVFEIQVWVFMMLGVMYSKMDLRKVKCE